MKDILNQYMKKRYQLKEMTSTKYQFPGPVITISRECGCHAITIANELVSKLQQITGQEWTVLTKEIIEEAAQKLGLQPKKLEYVFESREKSTWDEIFSAMSNKYYKSDKLIRKTIAEVVQAMARRGNCIIIGRGGISLAKDIEKSLHIRLQAPLKWRAEQLQKSHAGKLEEMMIYAQTVDKKRDFLRNFFNKTPLELCYFDVIFNSMKLKDKIIVNATISILKEKHII
ncbi:AAA family ATPase [Ancylomarina sp. 16SWW S1-10-2]|uniref:cytidylate kinase-like family protein n=1 Tax=Ancylomarina sp. 16SWW S1-10-2 TaxID=2499681 RepID=UPI0012ADF178|nr:cytidylate kinase-like family protein [Ancylomarina sp. 16SWW S1-10-2]MRT92987.1 cytidylate kinase-like family protein [Ancylomarina sp. 16SWW S1-10-2]